jgi:hypothetical protein
MPVRSLVRGPGVAALDSDRLFSTAAATDFSGSVPAVDDIDAGVVHLGVPYADGWHLRIDGDDAEHTKSLGWANRFDVASSGTAKLTYETSPSRWLAVLAQVLLWAIAIRFARRKRAAAIVEEPAT